MHRVVFAYGLIGVTMAWGCATSSGTGHVIDDDEAVSLGSNAADRESEDGVIDTVADTGTGSGVDPTDAEPLTADTGEPATTASSEPDMGETEASEPEASEPDPPEPEASEPDTGAPEATAPPEPELTGQFIVRTTGQWSLDGPTITLCERIYSFTGRAYVGACEDCRFEFALDATDATGSGDHCTSYAGVAALPGYGHDLSLIAKDLLMLPLGYLDYMSGHWNAIAVRRWEPSSDDYSYAVLASGHAGSGSGPVFDGDGHISWTDSESHLGDWMDWTCGEYGCGPIGYLRNFELDMSYPAPPPGIGEDEDLLGAP